MDYLAESFAASEAWSEIDQGFALTFLTALANQTSVKDLLLLGDASELAFVVSGWLLSSFPPEDRSWTAFLDTVLDQLELASETPA